jgi:hypothetical protein
MKGDLRIPDISQIAHEIMAYLAEHPNAQDTLEGIVQWWILERKIKYQKAMVQEAIRELVAKGLVLERRIGDSQCQYRLSIEKNREI